MSEIHTSHSRRQPIASPPLAVSPKEAGRLLGVGKTTLFRLLKDGELQSYTDRSRRSRRILVSSITAYICRRIAASTTDQS
jgi:excisionase family DNA binding protein